MLQGRREPAVRVPPLRHDQPLQGGAGRAATRSNGATKYVDEFFTWREVAHAFCFRSWPVLESTAVGLLSILRLAASLADVLVWSILSYVTRVPCLAETIRPQQSGQPYLKQCHRLIESSALPSEKTSRLACEVARHLGAAQALPQWSQQALQQHAGDPREVKSLHSWRTARPVTPSGMPCSTSSRRTVRHSSALSLLRTCQSCTADRALPPDVPAHSERADVALVPECPHRPAFCVQESCTTTSA